MQTPGMTKDYANHAQAQAAVINSISSTLTAAVEQMGPEIRKSSSPFVVADYGCATVKNSIPWVQAVCNTAREFGYEATHLGFGHLQQTFAAYSADLQ